MPYNLAEAGAATGKSKTTILRSIRNGLISAHQERPNAGWSIEPSELHRVFPRVTGAPDATSNETSELHQLQARLDDAHATIDDLRRRLDQESERLDAAAEDRRQLQSENQTLQTKLTAVLSDQRSTIIPVADQVSPRNFKTDDPAPRRNKRWFRWRRKSHS